MKTTLALITLALASAAADCAAQTAATYPAKPIRVIDAYPPGGSTDVVARLIAVKFQESTGRSWIVDNRPGAQGIIGTEAASKAPPDGYTLLMFTGSHAVHPSIYRNLPYDFLQAFAPITQTTATTNVLVVHPSVPVKTVKEVIALARSKPGQLNYSSAGIGSTTHMAMELFKTMARIDLTHIPYKGAAPAVMDGVGGHVAMLFGPMPVVTPHAKAGRLRIVAVSTKDRSRAIPDVPTVAEAGVPGFDATNSVGIVAPAATPRDLVRKISADIGNAVRNTDLRDKMEAQGMEPVGSTPEQFEALVKTEIAKWGPIVKASGAKAD